jgi:hypothetical protein
MDFAPTEQDLRDFLHLYERRPIKTNDGGMKAPDMFTLYWTCRVTKPNIVVESGVWRGQSTWLIRQVCGEKTEIVCLDPRENTNGWVDPSSHTTYLMGKKFVDFGALSINGPGRQGILCFFDDHQDAWERLQQCARAGIKKVLFNDNYPPGCGAHRTLAHCDPQEVRAICKTYFVFPNVVGAAIKTGDESHPCACLFDGSDVPEGLGVFAEEANAYRWNTFVELP